MPDFTLSFVGMIIILLLASIAAAIGYKCILSGIHHIHQQREQHVRWYRQPMILMGIALLIMSIGQMPNALVPIYAHFLNLSLLIKTLFNFIAAISLLFPFAVVLYLKILEVLSRRLPGDNEQSDEEIENSE